MGKKSRRGGGRKGAAGSEDSSGSSRSSSGGGGDGQQEEFRRWMAANPGADVNDPATLERYVHETNPALADPWFRALCPFTDEAYEPCSVCGIDHVRSSAAAHHSIPHLFQGLTSGKESQQTCALAHLANLVLKQESLRYCRELVAGTPALRGSGVDPDGLWAALRARLRDPYPKESERRGHAFKVLSNMARTHGDVVLAHWSGRVCELVDDARSSGGKFLDLTLGLLEDLLCDVLMGCHSDVLVDPSDVRAAAEAVRIADGGHIGPNGGNDDDGDFARKSTAGLHRLVVHIASIAGRATAKGGSCASGGGGAGDGSSSNSGSNSSGSSRSLVEAARERGRKTAHAHLIKVLAAVAAITPAGLSEEDGMPDPMPWDAAYYAAARGGGNEGNAGDEGNAGGGGDEGGAGEEDDCGSRAVCAYVLHECVSSAHLELQAVGLWFLGKAIHCARKAIDDDDAKNGLGMDAACEFYVRHALGGLGAPRLAAALGSSALEVRRMALILTCYLLHCSRPVVHRLFGGPSGAVLRSVVAFKARGWHLGDSELMEAMQVVEAMIEAKLRSLSGDLEGEEDEDEDEGEDEDDDEDEDEKGQKEERSWLRSRSSQSRPSPVPSPNGPFQPGDVVNVHSLTGSSASHYNDTCGTIISRSKGADDCPNTAGRYLVLLSTDATEKALKPANLEFGERLDISRLSSKDRKELKHELLHKIYIHDSEAQPAWKRSPFDKYDISGGGFAFGLLKHTDQVRGSTSLAAFLEELGLPDSEQRPLLERKNAETMRVLREEIRPCWRRKRENILKVWKSGHFPWYTAKHGFRSRAAKEEGGVAGRRDALAGAAESFVEHKWIFLTNLGPFMTLDLANLMGPGTRRWMAGTEPDSATLIFMLLDELCDHGIESAHIMGMSHDPREAEESKFATMHRDSHPFIFKFMCEKIRKDANACNAPPDFQWERGVVRQDVKYDPGQFAPDELADEYLIFWKALYVEALGSIIRWIFEQVLDAFNDDIIPPDAGGVDVMKHGGICDFCGAGASQRCGRCKQVYYCNRECLVAAYKTHKKSCRAFVNARQKKSGGTKES